jgi:hypothetical protein
VAYGLVCTEYHLEGRVVTDHLDIAITWPKSRSLESYLLECSRAVREGLIVNYRVARLPDWPVGAFDYGARYPRTYMVHDGFVRGWLQVIYVTRREDGEVEGHPYLRRGYWPAGNYIVRNPLWHPISTERQIPMVGFRGWRWFDPTNI